MRRDQRVLLLPSSLFPLPSSSPLSLSLSPLYKNSTKRRPYSKQAEGPPQEANQLTPDFRLLPSELWERNVFCLSYPVMVFCCSSPSRPKRAVSYLRLKSSIVSQSVYFYFCLHLVSWEFLIKSAAGMIFFPNLYRSILLCCIVSFNLSTFIK